MNATDRDTRQFLILADGSIEEILDAGADTSTWSAPGLYERLLLAGYPLCADPAGTFDGCIDVVTDGAAVIAQTNGPAPNEYDMGTVAELFLAWFHAPEQGGTSG